MTQLGLDLTPRSHNTDPASSHRAEQRCRKSGAMGSQTDAVARLLQSFTGRTARELTDIAIKLHDCDSRLSDDLHECHSQIMRRLSDLKNQKRARSQSTPGQDQVRWFHAGG